MKLVIIKSSPRAGTLRELFESIIKSKKHKNYCGTAAVELLLRERPHFVYLKLKEPVNGDDYMMTMLSSLDVNTRLRVSIINTELIKGYFRSVLHVFSNFILPGRHTHKLDTTP
jgi:hypothetical protein